MPQCDSSHCDSCRFVNRSGADTAISKCDKTGAALVVIGASKSSHTANRLPPYSPIVIRKIDTVDTSTATETADNSTDFMYDSIMARLSYWGDLLDAKGVEEVIICLLCACIYQEMSSVFSLALFAIFL